MNVICMCCSECSVLDDHYCKNHKHDVVSSVDEFKNNLSLYIDDYFTIRIAFCYHSQELIFNKVKSITSKIKNLEFIIEYGCGNLLEFLNRNYQAKYGVAYVDETFWEQEKQKLTQYCDVVRHGTILCIYSFANLPTILDQIKNSTPKYEIRPINNHKEFCGSDDEDNYFMASYYIFHEYAKTKPARQDLVT